MKLLFYGLLINFFISDSTEEIHFYFDVYNLNENKVFRKPYGFLSSTIITFHPNNRIPNSPLGNNNRYETKPFTSYIYLLNT